MEYEDDRRIAGILIRDGAGAAARHLECIRQAADHKVVAFENPMLQRAYQAHVDRPRIFAEARAELEKHGALHGFPKRADFGSDQLFAEALERNCGMESGSFFKADERGVLVRPTASDEPGAAAKDKRSCVAASVTHAYAKGESFGPIVVTTP